MILLFDTQIYEICTILSSILCVYVTESHLWENVIKTWIIPLENSSTASSQDTQQNVLRNSHYFFLFAIFGGGNLMLPPIVRI